MHLCLLSPVLAALVGSADPADLSVPKTLTSLMEIVPLETTSVWSWRSGEGTALLEERLQGVVDAVLDARFDQFALDAMDIAGASPDLVKELRGIRNVVSSVGGVVPWRDLLGREVVYAETQLSNLLPGTEMPGMLLACRPAVGQMELLEDSLAGFLGAVAGTVGFLRYDIHQQEYTGLGAAIQRYELVLRGEEADRALIQVASARDVILIGMGQEYFERAVDLLAGGESLALSTSPRFQRAFEGLPSDAAGRSFVDVTSLMSDLEELNAVLAGRSFNSGLWQGVLNGALDLAGTVDTLASTTRCEGTRVVTETLTRFDADSPAWVRAGLAQGTSVALLDFVPAAATSFEMRGPVDLGGVYRWGLERWQSDWAPAEDIVWVGNVVQAVLGLSIEQDILPWMGGEHVSIQVPSDASPGSAETVWISRLTEETGARKCLERAEGIFQAMAPRMVSQLQELLLEAQVPFSVDVQLMPGPREHPELRRLSVTAFPMLVKQMVFGTRDGYFVFATSEAALEACFAVSRGDAKGLEHRPLASELLMRENLCSASLSPMGAGVSQFKQLLSMGAGFLEGSQESMSEEDRDAKLGVHMALDLLTRVGSILEELDFLGDAVTASEARDQGRARYEISTLHLRLPEPVAESNAPIAEVTESTPW